jgi:hypothetical protein
VDFSIPRNTGNIFVSPWSIHTDAVLSYVHNLIVDVVTDLKHTSILSLVEVVVVHLVCYAVSDSVIPSAQPVILFS